MLQAVQQAHKMLDLRFIVQGLACASPQVGAVFSKLQGRRHTGCWSCASMKQAQAQWSL